MTNTEPFEMHAEEYESWFDKHRFAYQSELAAVRRIMPYFNNALEIGAGSGRFAKPLGIMKGIEPSIKMANIARKRGMDIIEGVAEALPFNDNAFDLELMITTVCFVDSVKKSFSESYRTLSREGHIIVGLIDRESPVGQLYLKYKNENVFYRHATFYSVKEIAAYLAEAGFGNLKYSQTIFRNLNEIDSMEPVHDGYGEGSFVAIRGEKLT